MSDHLSTCPLDCPDACSVIITVEDGKVTKLKGDPNHPITQGFACVKTYRYPDRQNCDSRLTYPQKRTGAKGDGVFERISWDEALDHIAGKLSDIIEQYGAEAVLPYCHAGTMGLIERDHPKAFFRALGASELDQTICSSTGGAAWVANYGPYKVGTAPQDVPHARYIVLWGINNLRSNSHLTPFLKAARKKGTHILHIDPYRNETSRFADEHWHIKVGTDAALALALGNVILTEGLEDKTYLASYADDLEPYRSACSEWSAERAAEFCGLDASDIRRLAHDFANAQAGYVRVGYGLTRNEGGGNAMRAITLLPALTGAWKHQGGGAMLSTDGGFRLNTRYNDGEHLQKPGVRRVNMNKIASTLAAKDDPIKALIVFNSNPAAVAPDSSKVRHGMAREDLFTVVLEHFQTDSADYADILLPATTFLEHPDLYISYGHYNIQWSESVVEPYGEAKPNSWVFSQLARRLGLSDDTLYWSSEQLARDMLNTDHPNFRGITFERLREEHSVQLSLPDEYRPYIDGSNFPDKKIRFCPPPRQLDFEACTSGEFPLRMISPPGSHILNTSMGFMESLLSAAGGEPQVIVHPNDAVKFGVEDGKRHLIISARGSIQREAVVSTDAREGTLIAVGQWWPKLATDKKSLNDLTDERLTDLGGGSTFGNMPVRIEALGLPYIFQERDVGCDI